MKGKLFIAGLALLALASCNKEDGTTLVNNDAQGQYLAVNLKMSGAPTTKAWDATKFQDASDEEIAVNKAQFLFFNGENQCADPYKVNSLTWGAPDHQDSDHKKADAIIVLRNPTAIPTSIVAILNDNTDIAKTTTMSQLITKDFAAVEGFFVMTNSVYVDNGEVVIGTPVTEANIGKTEQEALAAPVEIHVERVLAKVELDKTAATQDTDSKVTDSAEKEISVEITGFWLDYTNPDAYLVKSLTANALPGTWWNDAPNFRSYWAKSVETAAENMGRAAYKDANLDAKYVNENTPKAADVATDGDDSENHAATQIVFATQLKVDGQVTDIVKYLSSYYTLANWKTFIVNTYSNLYTKTTAESGEVTLTRVTADDITWSTPAVNTNDAKVENPDWDGTSTAYATGQYIEDWEAVITVQSNKPLFYANGNAADPEGGKAIDKKYKVQFFNQGKSYFYAPIRHNDTLFSSTTSTDSETGEEVTVITPKDGYYGIVRNHLYKVKATKIYGLGTPVANPDKIIIPVKPEETESYIAAEIDVLKYKVVENEYELK